MQDHHSIETASLESLERYWVEVRLVLYELVPMDLSAQVCILGTRIRDYLNTDTNVDQVALKQQRAERTFPSYLAGTHTWLELARRPDKTSQFRL